MERPSIKQSNAMVNTPPIIARLLEDSLITDICINVYTQENCEIYIDQGQGMERVELAKLNNQEMNGFILREWVFSELTYNHKSYDAKNPFCDIILSSGHRAHFLFSPITTCIIVISIRKRPARNISYWQNDPSFNYLKNLVLQKKSIIICGSTGSGKTRLLSELLSCVSRQERIIALEDCSEIQTDHPHFLSLQSRSENADGYGEITIRNLLKQCLRMRPDRIILGECRGAEILDLLLSLNTGHQGAMATLHSNSASEAIQRIETLALLFGNANLQQKLISDLIFFGIQYIIFLNKENGMRRIAQINKVASREIYTHYSQIILEPQNPLFLPRE